MAEKCRLGPYDMNVPKYIVDNGSTDDQLDSEKAEIGMEIMFKLMWNSVNYLKVSTNNPEEVRVLEDQRLRPGGGPSRGTIGDGSKLKMDHYWRSWISDLQSNPIPTKSQG